jgi:prephenate dehydratase
VKADWDVAEAPGLNARVGLDASSDIDTLAALRSFAPLATPIICDNREEVFQRLESGAVEFAFMTAGNSHCAAVLDSFEHLSQRDVAIVGEFVLEPGTTRYLLLGQGHWRRDQLRFREGLQAGPVWFDFPALARGRTSVVFALPDEPGALVRALGAISRRHLNLSNLEMRPPVDSQAVCTVVAEIDGYAHDEPVKSALDELNRLARDVRVLGAYPAAAVE